MFAAKDLPDKGEIIGDLKRLSLVFEHVEKLISLAASIHRKMSQAPRLSRALFDDYFSFYLPRMGTGSAGNGEQKVTAFPSTFVS